MINVTDNFKKKNESKAYLVYISLTLSDGTELNITNENIWQGGFSIEDAVSADSTFEVGDAIINKCSVVINNIYDDFSNYDFADAVANIQVGLELDNGTVEKIHKGVFTVDETKYNGSLITLSMLDNMNKFDKEYSSSNLTYPATLLDIVKDACDMCGVVLNTLTFHNYKYVVSKRPSSDKTTYREVIAWAAQIACCFCRCDIYGRLELKWFNTDAFTDTQTHKDELHDLSGLYSTDIATDDVVITGVQVTETNEVTDTSTEGETYSTTSEVSTTYLYGAEGYVIAIDSNDLIHDGNGESIAKDLGSYLVGLTFRNGTVSHSSDPTIEAGDVAILTDRKGKKYNFLVSSTTFSKGSSQTTKSSAETPSKNSSVRFTNEIKNYVKLKGKIENESSAREKAQEYLSQRIDDSAGLFTTLETDSTGGTIYYMHNKPTLAESDIVWKMTAEAWGVSTDGGKTYNAGMTVDGETIVKILSATGIKADWIDTGSITVKDSDGNIVLYVDADTGQFVSTSGKIGGWTINKTRIKSSDSIGVGLKEAGLMLINEEGYPWIRAQDSTGTAVFQISRDGKLFIVGDGTFSGALKAATGTFSGTLKAASGDFSGEITATSGSVGGWKLTDTRLASSDSIYIGAKEAGLMLINESGKPFIHVQDASSNTLFKIEREGKMYAADAEIHDSSVEYAMTNYKAMMRQTGTSPTELCIVVSKDDFETKTYLQLVDKDGNRYWINTGDDAKLKTVTTTGAVTVGGKLTASGELNVSGALTASGDLSVSGELTASGGLTASNNPSLSWDIVKGSTTATLRRSGSSANGYGLAIAVGSTVNDLIDNTGKRTWLKGGDAISAASLTVSGSSTFSTNPLIKTLHGGTSYPALASATSTTAQVSYIASHVNSSSVAYLGVYGKWDGSSWASKNIVSSASDIRLKENVEDSEVDALAVITAIKMRQFDWKGNGYHQKVGFIADELEEVDPRLAFGGGYTEDGGMDTKTVDTFYLLAYTVKAIQEQQEIIAAQAEKIASLEERLAKIEAMLGGET